jgi:hypothetical protein
MPETELSGAQANANQTDSPINTLGKPASPRRARFDYSAAFRARFVFCSPSLSAAASFTGPTSMTTF